jgi:nitrogen-specific signal transduction histidine kinase/ActR/RegA family two-component response regulator
VTAAVEERMRAEEELRQSQKMEAIGQLTGGVAHDFNNLLTLVIGGLDLIDRQLPSLPAGPATDRIRRARDTAMEGARRAAKLTQHLLAFARRQPLQPRVIELNRLITEISDMLRRTIGEQVELEAVLGAGLWSVETDPVQLENAILNLAVNARDAMPGGGRLLVETATVELAASDVEEVPAGRYTTLTITDTGAGMGAEQLERLFEPFYSTKEEAGVGLGLATVYGIVRQSDGHVTVSSAPGRGTRFRIFLPASAEPVPDEPDAPVREPAAAADGATVLLVEDEPTVRAVIEEMLSESGYTVLAACDGPGALALAGAHDGPIDLLVTDVVMPGMSGQEVARLIAEERPSTRTLFVSGYNESAVARHGVLAPGTAFLEKPFSAGDLARKARELLDAAPVG